MYMTKSATFISKFTKKVSFDVNWVHTERTKFWPYECKLSSKIKVISSITKLYRMHLRHLAK